MNPVVVILIAIVFGLYIEWLVVKRRNRNQEDFKEELPVRQELNFDSITIPELYKEGDQLLFYKIHEFLIGSDVEYLDDGFPKKAAYLITKSQIIPDDEEFTIELIDESDEVVGIIKDKRVYFTIRERFNGVLRASGNVFFNPKKMDWIGSANFVFAEGFKL